MKEDPKRKFGDPEEETAPPEPGRQPAAAKDEGDDLFLPSDMVELVEEEDEGDDIYLLSEEDEEEEEE